MDKMVNVSIGQRVKEDLLSRGITTKHAAKMLKVTPAAVSVYFSGRQFSHKAAKKWAETFKLNEQYLLTGEGSPSSYVMMAVSPKERDVLMRARRLGGLGLFLPGAASLRYGRRVSSVRGGRSGGVKGSRGRR